jgi:hypothetical protein
MSEGPEGQVGPEGDVGARGKRGFRGKRGDRGLKGDVGDRGKRGLTDQAASGTHWVLFLITTTAIILGVLAYWAFRPYDNVIVEPSTNLRTQHVPGDILTVSTPICTHGTGRIHVVRKLISQYAADFLLPQEVYPQNPDQTVCLTSVSSVQLPDDLRSGEWRYEIELTYQANPIRSIMVESITPPFTVTAPPIK